MRIKFYLITALSFLLIAGNLFSQDDDSVKVYWLNQIEVTSKKENVGDASFPIEKDCNNKPAWPEFELKKYLSFFAMPCLLRDKFLIESLALI